MAKDKKKSSGLFVLIIVLAVGVFGYHKWDMAQKRYEVITEAIDAYSDAANNDQRRPQLQILLKTAPELDAKLANMLLQYVYLGALDIQDKDLQKYCQDRLGNIDNLTAKQIIPCDKCAKTCKKCRGTGKCPNCDGTGKRNSDSMQGKQITVNCPKECTACRGTGRDLNNCTKCYGKGEYPATPKDKMESLGADIKEILEQKKHIFKNTLENIYCKMRKID